MVRKVVKRKPTSSAVKFVVTAHFKTGKKVQIGARNAAEKAKAVALIRKHSPSARITTRTA
jgi:hypothetical protein